MQYNNRLGKQENNFEIWNLEYKMFTDIMEMNYKIGSIYKNRINSKHAILIILQGIMQMILI